MAELVIRGGTVVDGTGAPPVRADVALDGDRIVEVGRVEARGRRELDADGLLVTPGFVDIHTHFDGQATWDPVLAPSSWHGVTSIAMGNCGVGFAPARPDHHEFLISLLEGVEDIPGTALAEGLTWEWESFPEYLDALERTPHTVDLGAHVPHAALRAYVMGERGADHTEAPTHDELTRMVRLVAEAMDAGALGFATSRTEAHRTSRGQNIGTLRADAAELLALVEAVGRSGRGVIQLISDAYQTTDDDFAAAELDLIEAMARTSGRPLSFTVQQALHSPDRWRHLMGRVDRWVADGLDVKGQVALRPIGVVLGLEATVNPFLPCPSFQEVARLALPERVAALGDPDRKARILAEHSAFAESSGGSGATGFFRQLATSFDLVFRLDDPVDYQLDAADALGARAAREGRDPASDVYDALLELDGRRLLYLPLFNFAKRDLSDLAEMVQQPNALFGLSDAGAHCGAIIDASATTSSLVQWARDRRDGPPLPLEWLVHGHTQRNARHVGWHDRGVVAPGYLADLNLIDYPALACAHPEIIRDLPAGGRRLVQRADGYRATVKSGVVTFADGEHTGALPGRLLRS
jgi:N-acyl-D-aspartate/D-glutamate deacylase